MSEPAATRTERDSLGPMEVPADALYGASTARAIENFPISGLRLPRAFIRALALVKLAAARVNRAQGRLDAELAGAIEAAAAAVAAGEHDAHFAVDVFQTGSGTSTHMNANEVIANLASLSLGGHAGQRGRVHPNDHVNLGQSSNDVFPTALHVAATCELRERLIPAATRLAAALADKAHAFEAIVKLGRTHLQDAVPMTLGQAFSGYAAQVERAVRRIETVLPGLAELAVGGTAVGTGLNTTPDFGARVAQELSRRTGHAFVEAGNHFEAQAARDACVDASGTLRVLAVALAKIAGDLRWLGSGPRAGLGEIELPAVQPGSSIMPGKVNPVIPEMVIQVSAQVIGNDLAVTLGGAGGRFELNLMMPLIAHNLLQSIALLHAAVETFRARCVAGIEARADVCRRNVERSLMLATALAPEIGYDAAAGLAQEALRSNRGIREVAAESGLLDQERLDALLDIDAMARPRPRG
jgi:fumarate hydratase class II